MGILNTVDYVIIVLVILGGIKGAIKGFLEELSQKFGLFIGLVASLMFTQSVAPMVQDRLSMPQWAATGLSYVVIFLVGYLLMKLIGSLFQAIFKSSNLEFVDGLLGFFLGAFELVIVLGVIVLLLQHQSLINVDQYIKGSFLVTKVITPCINWAYGLVQKVI